MALKDSIYQSAVRPNTQKTEDNAARRAHIDDFLSGVDSCLSENEIHEPHPTRGAR